MSATVWSRQKGSDTGVVFTRGTENERTMAISSEGVWARAAKRPR